MAALGSDSGIAAWTRSIPCPVYSRGKYTTRPQFEPRFPVEVTEHYPLGLLGCMLGWPSQRVIWFPSTLFIHLGNQFKVVPPRRFWKLSGREQEITVMPAAAQTEILERCRDGVTTGAVIAFSGSCNEITTIWVGLIRSNTIDLRRVFFPTNLSTAWMSNVTWL